jgi:ABC-type phosphate transport system substrate-binding protein
MGGSGNAGVAAIVKKVPESIGYVELAYAKTNTLQSLTGNGAGVTGSGLILMPYAYVQNHDKTAFLDATVATTTAAATGAIFTLPAADGDWSQVSINDAPGPNAYPITTFTYLLVNPNLEQLKGMDQKADDLVHMLYWFVTDGQNYATKLNYVPLPDAVQELDKKGISEIKFNGKQIWSYP